jgi:hypothetical protein
MEKDDWADHVAEARRLKQEELDARLTEIIHKATEVMAEGLIYGDEVMSKTGEIVRRRVPAKDAAFIASILADKRTLIRGEPTSITKASKSSKDALAEIKKGLEEIGKKEEDYKLTPTSDNDDKDHVH